MTSGPKSWVPWLGAGLHYARDPFGFFRRLHREYGDLCVFGMAGQRFHLVCRPDAVEHVLIRNRAAYEKGPVLNALPEVLGGGLLTAEGDRWRRNRSLVQPLFHRERIEGFAGFMRAITLRALGEWHARGPHVRAIDRDMHAITLDIIVSALFGRNLRDASRAGAAFAEISRYFEFAISPFGQLARPFPHPRRNRYLRAVRFLDALIAERLRAVEAEPDTLLAGLARAYAGEPGQLRDEVMTLFLAGHETSAAGLTFCLDQLARRPDVCERIRTEGRDYLGKVIRESLRVYPPVWTIGRQAIRADELGGHRIEPGEIVLIPTWVIHRLPRYFPDPERFEPDRWGHGFEASLPRGAYLPFGLGPRSCIGGGWAQLEMELILSEIVSRFSLEAVSSAPPGLRGTLTLRPREAVQVRVTPLAAG